MIVILESIIYLFYSNIDHHVVYNEMKFNYIFILYTDKYMFQTHYPQFSIFIECLSRI